MLLITLIILVFATNHALGNGIEDCSNIDDIGKLIDADVNGCDFSFGNPCTLQKDTNVTITIDFEAVKPFSQAIISVTAKKSVLVVPIDIIPRDACGNYGFDCPVKAGQKLKLVLKLYIKPEFPTVNKMKVKAKLMNESNKQIGCIRFPARIKA